MLQIGRCVTHGLLTIMVVLETTWVEKRLIEAAQAGEILDVSEAPKCDVRAEVIRGLLVGRHAEELDPRGVRLRGARIVGSWIWLMCAPRCRWCWRGARMRSRSLFAGRTCRTSICQAVRSRLWMPGGFVCEHDVQLRGIRCAWLHLIGADIAGQLTLHRAVLQAAEVPALNAERLTVGNGLFLTEGFVTRSHSARGTLCFLGASITGPLELDGARLEAARGPALNADWLTVNGSVFFNEGFMASSDCARGPSACRARRSRGNSTSMTHRCRTLATSARGSSSSEHGSGPTW